MAASGNYIAESDVDNWSTAIAATEDFATTDVVIATEKITVVNDIATCTELIFSSTGVVPAPLVTGTIYYAIRDDATHIQVALTPVLAAAGTAINLTDVGSGTHTLDIGSGASESERQEVIDRAEQLIENITKDYFYAKDFAIYLDGNANDKLFLGLIPHILINTAQLFLSDLAMAVGSTQLASETGGFTSAMVGQLIYISEGTNFDIGWYEIVGYINTNTVTLNKTATTAGAGSGGVGAMGGVVEIKISGIKLTESWWTFDIDSVYLDPEAATGDELPELLLRLKYKRKIFPKGMGNIKVTGTYGWSACPVAIKRAVIILCRYENDNTLYSAYSGSLKSEKLGDYAYTLANGTSTKESTGVSEADALIKNYIRKRPMMGVA